MFYTYLRNFVTFLLWMLNGNAHYHNTEKILVPVRLTAKSLQFLV